MLIRYDPFAQLDRLSDQIFGGSSRRGWIPMDAVRSDEGLELHFDLPGVAPESIDVSVERNVLTIKAERSWTVGDGKEAVAQERGHGRYTRQVFLGDAFDTDRLDARYDHGVLSVTIPTAERAKPRKVEVKVGEALEKADEPLEVTAAS